MSVYQKNREKILFLTQFSMLLALEAIVCFTPLGSLPAMGPIVATLGMIPLIITAIMLGTGAGALMGFFTGLFSFLVWTFTPKSPMAFVFTPFYSVGKISGNFWSLVICFVPRILTGVITGLCFTLFSRLGKFKIPAYAISGVLGSLTNTILVICGIFLFFGNNFTKALKLPDSALKGVLGGMILMNGIPEAVLGGIAAFAICYPLHRYLKHKR